MSIRFLRSAGLSVSLGLALLLSLLAHALRGGGVRSRDACHVAAVESSGDPTRPLVFVDFDANLGLPVDATKYLGTDIVSLEPAVPIIAKVVSPRRISIEPRRALAPFSTYRVRLGASLSAADGRPVDAEGGARLAFESGVFGLAGDQLTRIDDTGARVVALAFTGPVAEGSLKAHVRLLDASGEELRIEIGGSGANWSLTTSALPANAAKLVVRAGLASSSGGNPIGADDVRELRWSDVLAVEGVAASFADGVGEIRISFNRGLAVPASDFLSVTPSPANLTRSLRAYEVTLRGAFTPGTSVAVTARANLPSSSGLRLAGDVRRSVRIPEPSPRLAFSDEGTVLSTEAVPSIDFEGVNVSEVLLEARRVFPNNVVPLALGWARENAASGEALTRRFAIDDAAHTTWHRSIDLASLLGPTRRGLWSLRISDPRTSWRDDGRLLQLTDLAPVVRVHPDGLAVFVSRIADGSAVAGAKVVAFTVANQPAADGTTDRDGLLVLRGLDASIRIVTVSTPDDTAFVDVEAHAIAHDGRDVAGVAPALGLEAYVRADRGLVRPGETARVDVIVRTRTGEAPADGLPVTVRLFGPEGHRVKSVERRAGIGGLVDTEFALGVDAPTGAYRVEARVPGREDAIGQGSFRVEAFVPDRLEATVTPPPGPVVLGATVPIAVRARFLTGEPAAGLTIRGHLTAEAIESSPVAGFTFGDRDAPAPTIDARERSATLDAKGEATLEVALPPAGASGLARRVTFVVDVIDVSGRGVSASASRDAIPAGARLGLALADVPTTAVVVEVASAGGDVEGAKAVLSRVEWVGGYVIEHRRHAWRSERVETVVETLDVALDAGRGRATFREPGDGSFVVRVTSPSAATAASSFTRVVGRTRAEARTDGSPRLSLAVEGVAHPGARIALLVDAPFAGRALLGLEGPGVFSQRSVDVPAGTSRVAFDVPADASPSFHVVMTLVRGARDAKAGMVRALGAVAVQVERGERTVRVALDAPTLALPEASFDVQVETSEPCEVVLHLVDEGVLRRTHHADADPVRHFGAVRALGTTPADAYARLLAGTRYPSDDPDPGGGDAGELGARLDPTARNVIETVSLSSRRIFVDGEATVRFDVPAYEGRLRLCAIVAGRRGTGRAACDVVVKGPVAVAIHMPRAVAPGDEFDAAVELRGDHVESTVELDGFERTGDAFPLRLRALSRTGIGSVTIRAHDALGNAIVRTARASIRPASPRIDDRLVVSIAPRDPSPRALPRRYVPGTESARVTVGMGPLVDLLPALERLSEYPYGCVEQTTSKAFPVLAWSTIVTLTMPDGGRPDDIVEAAIDRLFTMQTASGGLAMWPGNSTPARFGTTYAVHFLLEAKRLGRAVPEDRLDAALAYVAHAAKEDPTPYEAYVLALAGRHRGDIPGVDGSVEDRAYAAATALLTGDRLRAAEILKGVGDPWAVSAVPTESTWDLASPVRAAAVLLEALSDVDPADPRADELETRLRTSARAAAANQWTTQENAAALLAIARRHQKARETGAGASGTLHVGNRSIEFTGPEGATLAWVPGDPWTFSVDSASALTVAVRVAGVPTEAPENVAHGMTITRHIEGAEHGYVQGRVYTVVLEGTMPSNVENCLLSDVLPGGLEIEEARDVPGDWYGDRVEVRDDRVLWFRTKATSGETFRQTYRVRAVTPGRFHVPPASIEALYDPTRYARGGGGDVIEVRREK